MATQDALKLIDEIWGSVNPQEAISKLINSNFELKNNVAKLKNLYEKLKLQHTFVSHSMKRSKLSSLLDYQGLRININDQTNTKQLTEDIFEAYHLTSIILQQLGLISEVKYTFTFIDNNGNFYRLGDADLELSDIKLEAASRGRGYSIRLKESAIKAKIYENTLNKTNEIINQHFQKFAEPFYKYEASNKKNWKINKGVLAEAFERHWENLQHDIQNPGQIQNTSKDLGTIGARWWLYRQSSGSDPYFTGPDTMFSQVKNANASLIDNINTVLNTTVAVLKIVEDANNIPNITEKIKQAFLISPERPKIATAIWDGLEKSVQKDLIKAIGANAVTQKGKNIFFDTTKA